MNRPLVLRVPLEFGETASSLASRLAVRNGSEDAQAFCKDMNLTWRYINDGEEGEVQRLAEIADVDPAKLLRFSIRTRSSDECAVGSEVFPRKFLSRKRARACPLCVSDNIMDDGCIGVVGKAWWDLRSFRICEEHRTPLQQTVVGRSRYRRHDFSARLTSWAKQIETTAGRDSERYTAGFERYVISRLTGKKLGVWIDELDIPVIARACETLGLLSTRGAGAVWGRSSEEELREATEAGFAILSEGQDAFVMQLEELCLSKRGSGISHHQDLGPLFKWLNASQSNYRTTAIKNVVRDFILSNYPIAAGATVLGFRNPERKLYTINNAYRELGITLKHTGYLMIEAGLAWQNPSTNSPEFIRPLPRQKIEEFAMKCTESASLNEAGRYLNVTGATVLELVDAGLVTVTAVGLRRVSRFFRPKLIEFREKMLSDRLAVDDLDPEFVLIADAARNAKCKTSEILKLISDREIRSVVRLKQEKGLRSLAVQTEEVIRALPKFENAGIPRDEAARLLKASPPTITLLLKLGYLKPVKARRATTRYLCEMVSFASMNKFAHTRISLAQLAEELGRTPGPLLQQLEAKNFRPIGAISGDRISRFFLRTDVPAIQNILGDGLEVPGR